MRGFNSCEHDRAFVFYEDHSCPLCEAEQESAEKEDKIAELKATLDAQDNALAMLQEQIDDLKKDA